MKNFTERYQRHKSFIEYNFPEASQDTLATLDGVCHHLNKKDEKKKPEERILVREITEAVHKLIGPIPEYDVHRLLMEVIYESEELLVCSTGHDYDFIATMEVNEDADPEDYHPGEDLMVVFTDDYEYLKPVRVPRYDWVGILADDEGYDTVQAIENGKFYTIWADDYEEEQE